MNRAVHVSVGGARIWSGWSNYPRAAAPSAMQPAVAPPTVQPGAVYTDIELSSMRKVGAAQNTQTPLHVLVPTCRNGSIFFLS